mmetsp:Transcript_22857/g.17314  ORF Transcript_22857/g.17314 Transcript_22857/m.17314 type:complete len:206 (+) Transcript_22857:1779-2396(+)|eukprot:CAMPEP_0202959160 /NCGR_PEP_ID=MMETSP1396-20130829/3424_1 /ASSEMBLY_ACC=CAM_ASM_000872 /TAXON_ID= /ORGANISM="Pseudokeronopsis sp., Strain Brazil" /LENGTH=205 /DNA_ID=CAMNT_0049677611 /DNA_START=1830 /DNA_END=2447 /DNA_ORIENTATION=-
MATLSENSMVMSPSLVASLMLVNRKVGHSMESLLAKMQWLYEEIKSRDGLTALNVKPTQATLKHALSVLTDFLEKHARKEEFTTLKPNNEYKSILMLAYYRNNLSHVFINESYIACSLKAIGVQDSGDRGTSLQRLYEQVQFLQNVFKDEFIVRDYITSYESFLKQLYLMQRRNFVVISKSDEGQELVRIHENGNFGIEYLASLL